MKLENFKNQKAITLVALIITVIVLLILATVSISLVINSGIISKAEYATDLYAIEQLKEQLYLKSIENNEDSVTGKLSDLNLNINKDLINKYDDILYVKDGKLYLSFIAAFPDTDLYKNNKEKIEKFKDLEICYDGLKEYNKVVNPYFDNITSGFKTAFYSNSTARILNDNNNNFLHLEIRPQGDRTSYIYQEILASNYNDIVYTNLKYRNIYVDNAENYKINDGIIRTRVPYGYAQNFLNSNDYILSYNSGWKNTSDLRTIQEKHSSLIYTIKIGGSDSMYTSWNYTLDIDDVYSINLTEIFGAGNEPTKEQMDEIFNNF